MIRHVLGYCIALITGIMLHSTLSAQSVTTVQCFPDNSAYTTGTVSASQKIDTLIYAAGGGSRGFMKFNISAIPDGVTITEVKLTYFIMNSDYPYYRFTRLQADPVTTAAPNLYALIGQATTSNSIATYYTYTGPEQIGQQQAVLNTFAKNDLQNALTQDWFAIGLYEFDPDFYYLQVAGRNMTTMPYLTVSYLPSFQNDAGLLHFSSPLTQITPGQYPVSVVMKNFGTNYLFSATIDWTVDGLVQPVYYFQDTLSPQSSRVLTLGNFQFTAGTHILTATVSLPNGQTDPNAANNAITQTFYVYVPPVYCHLDSIYSCNEDTIMVPVQVQNFGTVSGFTLHLQVDTSQLQFLSWSGLNNQLGNPAGFQAVMNGDILTLSWNSTALAGFNWNTLVYLYFTPVGSGCHYSLNWIDSGPNASAFFGTNGTVLTSSFSDGYICHTLPPAAPGPVTGSSPICSGSTFTYAISPVPGAYSYWWEVPAGATITGGWASTSISVYFSPQAVSGIIRVRAVNGCGSGPASDLQVSIHAVPGPTTYLYGPTEVCPGSTPVTFACALIPGAVSYQWVLPYGMTAQSTYSNSIVVMVQSGFTGGYIQVSGQNSCGIGQAAYMYVSVCPFPQDSLTCILPEVSGCEGLLHYPVIIRNGYDIASISLGIQFDPDHLSYSTYSNPHPGLASGFLMVNSTASTVQIGWFSVTPVDLEDDTLLFLDFQADTGFSSLQFDLQTTGSCFFTDLNNVEMNAWYVSGYVYTGICASLSGILTYDNPASTPVTNTVVTMGNWYSAQSGTDGGFEFPSVGSGTWLLQAEVNKPAGGINATDALKVLNHFVNTQPLSGLKLQAADVDGTGFVNAADGLMIAKRFVGMISTFPVGDWLSEEPLVTIAGSGSFTQDLKAICFGDLDGSFVPAIKEQSAVEISANGLGIETLNKTFRLPLISTHDAEVGAVSLVIALPSDQYRLLSVEGPDHGQLVWNQLEGEIRIAWFDGVPMRIESGNALLELTFSLEGEQPASGDRFTIQAVAGSSIANVHADPFSSFDLVYPDRFESTSGFLQVSPNPASSQCIIDFCLSTKNTNRLRLFNSIGTEVWSKEFPAEISGVQQYPLDLTEYSAGSYLLILENGNQVLRKQIIKE